MTPIFEHRRYHLRGIVQGVGLRPFVHRLATAHGVAGLVRNDGRGVELEIEAPPARLDAMMADLVALAPPLAEITEIELTETLTGARRHRGFAIEASQANCAREVVVTPDAGICDDCLRELFDSTNRRYRHPFVNCTNCGPRFSILCAVPYDREHTTMAAFTMCSDCAREYADPLDRRFHAQPNACWTCGPRVRLLERGGREIAGADPVEACARLLEEGAIAAVKGVGGYHLMCDPTNEAALAALRDRKRRPHKPFALMSARLEAVRRYAHVDAVEAAALASSARPIVLLRRREPAAFSELVAPGLGDYGVMLAYTPLHHLLLGERFEALVATSGNLTDEPIVHREADLPTRLGSVADVFLTHDRDIHNRVDDSIVRCVVVGGVSTASVVRRARGYTPKPIRIGRDLPCVLAVGGDLKNTICVTRGRELYASQHIGDLANVANFEAFVELCERMPRLLGVRPEVVAHDLHPDFRSSRFARDLPGVHAIAVQHHHAHLAACAGEHDLDEPVLGVAFDGMGYGTDGTAWGGEFLLGSFTSVRRVGRLRPLGLPGADRAVHEPFRVACALLADALGPEAAEDPDLQVISRIPPCLRPVLRAMIEGGVNTPHTSSAGRLFDGVAALLGVRDVASYEGQAAVELERLARDHPTAEPFGFAVASGESGHEIDLRPMVRELVADLKKGADVSVLAARFHATLARAVREVCADVCGETGVRTVVLTGGVFVNSVLSAQCHQLLERDGARVLRHHRVPTNDGGLAFGQALVAAFA